MPSLKQMLLIAPTLLAIAHAQGVILSAQGTSGSPASLALQVKTAQSDANIINQNEINTNVVNECGRTLLAGNIDIGENTETQLANKTVTSVTKGSKVAVTIKQVDENGAGPYMCDLDLTSNADGVSGQTNLTVAETDASNGNISLSVIMPSDLACVGASTGNICTVRCFNSATAGPFGGCFAVQQTDITPNANSPDTIATAQTLEGVLAQVAQNQIDLPAAIKANQEATTGTEAQQGVLAVDNLLSIDSTASATAGAAGVASTSSGATAKSTATAKGTTGKGTASKGTTAKSAANKGGKAARMFVS
ncbi:hypothetical protein G7Y89_g14627 [Cudoniella acicularis]|uniref:GEgh 16 protein n=1 Tax=Cudoniella acicularis TaxID=354080 RepID=A0A8H4QYX9_9HELO|nr:hypothetical protein G7Y89_g14627 [Cudoniella acicularis]